MRRLIAFPCAEETLLGTIDTADGMTGLLIVSGGDEVRVGAHRGMAQLADAVAEQGFPVFRYDRRGIGDSGGSNGGYAGSADDLAAAVHAFRTEYPELRRIVGLGLCDGATALALFGADAGIDGFILANPYVEESDGDLPPASAIRARYGEKMRDPRSVGRLLSGGVNLGLLRKGLGAILSSTSQALADQVGEALAAAERPTTILLATGDATAIAFEAAFQTAAFAAIRERVVMVRIPTGSHSFARAEDSAAFTRAVIAALEKSGRGA